MDKTSEIQKLGKMLTATTIEDVERIDAIANRLLEIAITQKEIIHNHCGKTIEECDCEDARVNLDE